MLNIGLLYSHGDQFTLQRSDLFVGPILLAGAQLIRFNHNDIEGDGSISGQRYDKTHWVDCQVAKLDAILDLSLGGSTRNSAEKALLEATPHSLRIDRDNLEIQQALALHPHFDGHIVPAIPLSSFADIKRELKTHDKLVIKKRRSHQAGGVAVVSKPGRQWQVAEAFEQTSLSAKAFEAWLAPKLTGDHYLQPYVASVTTEGKQFSLEQVLHKRHDGCWSTPHARAVIATDGEIASLDAGGIFIGSPLKGATALVDPSAMSRGWASGVSNKLQCFGLAVAHQVERLYGAPPALLGLNVMLDDKNRPQLLSVDPQPPSTRSPGRSLELYRQAAEFMVAMARKQLRSDIAAKPLPPSQNRGGPAPQRGLSVCGAAPLAGVVHILQQNTPWIDLSLGQGGKQLLRDLGKVLRSRAPAQRPFLSLRLGHALNDTADGRDMRRHGAKSLEDYIGAGTMTYHESEFMRSLRTPLLEYQLNESLRLLAGASPDLLWLEDGDLSVSVLEEDQVDKNLAQTAAWFDARCEALGMAHWGVLLNNPHSPHSKELVRRLAEHANKLGLVGSKTLRAQTNQIEALASYGMDAVLTAKHVEAQEIAAAEEAGVRLLAWWRFRDQGKVDQSLYASEGRG